MGFLKGIIRDAVSGGIDRGIRNAVSGAVEKAINPVAENWANKVADDLEEATGLNNAANSTNATGEAITTGTAQSGNAFDRLAKAAADYEKSVNKGNGPQFLWPEVSDNREYMNKFLDLVDLLGGFEMVLGYRDWVDHSIGGKGNQVWYMITHKSESEFYIGTKDASGNWTDEHFVKRNGEITSGSAESGRTIGMVAAVAYRAQDRIAGRTPSQQIDCSGFMCDHYVFSFGEWAVDIAKDYGVTVEYSDINKEDEGYRLRDIYVGGAAQVPNPEEV